MDAPGAFTYLADSVPVWITQITNLAAHTAAKHAEYTEVYKKYATPAKPCRWKNSSVCSIHVADLFPQQKDPESRQDAKNDETDGAAPSTTDALMSTRHNVIIHYDGHTQQSLEDMVCNIGTARNNIRRARMVQMPPMPGRIGSPDLMLSYIRSVRNRGHSGTRQGMTAFNLADKHLEVAHGLCESAAYQFLRSGDCKADLDSVVKKFRILLVVVGAELQRLNWEQSPSAFEPKMEEDKGKLKHHSSSDPSAAEPTNKPQALANGSATGPIEVDDAESLSVESIDLTAFRANHMHRMRP